jgi:hypothetical protein
VADQLITPAELASALHIPFAQLDTAAAALGINAATAHVQLAAGQRLVAVVGDQVELPGTTSWWLRLPERPVTAVTAVTLDGAAIADWTQHASRLWRDNGWQNCRTWQPSKVAVTYNHGYPTGDQKLEPARSYVFPLAASVYDNPTLAEALAIDDYRASYGPSGSTIGLTKEQARELRRAYSTIAGPAPA